MYFYLGQNSTPSFLYDIWGAPYPNGLNPCASDHNQLSGAKVKNYNATIQLLHERLNNKKFPTAEKARGILENIKEWLHSIL
jgi:hypothetical protein